MSHTYNNMHLFIAFIPFSEPIAYYKKYLIEEDVHVGQNQHRLHGNIPVISIFESTGPSPPQYIYIYIYSVVSTPFHEEKIGQLDR